MRALAFSLLFVFACLPKPVPVVPGPAPAPNESLTCADVCEHLHALECPAGGNTPKGATCLDVCRGVQESGVIAWNLSCLVQSQTCAGADACPADIKN